MYPGYYGVKYKIKSFDILLDLVGKVYELAESGLTENGLVILANKILSDKYFGRYSERLEGKITLGIIYRPGIMKFNEELLILMAVIGVGEAIRSYALDIRVGWLSDIFVGEKKIAYVSCKIINSYYNPIILVEVNVNINVKEFPEEFRDKFTSMQIESGRIYDVNSVVNRVLMYVDENYRLLTGGYQYILLNKWRRMNNIQNKDIEVKLKSGEKIIGKALDINEDCKLEIKLRDGSKTLVSYKDVEEIMKIK